MFLVMHLFTFDFHILVRLLETDRKKMLAPYLMLGSPTSHGNGLNFYFKFWAPSLEMKWKLSLAFLVLLVLCDCFADFGIYREHELLQVSTLW